MIEVSGELPNFCVIFFMFVLYFHLFICCQQHLLMVVDVVRPAFTMYFEGGCL